MAWKKYLIVIAALFLIANVLPVVADDDGMQRASGAARISFIFGGLVVDRYEFSAVHHSDGRVTGRFNFRSKYDDEDILASGEVICVTVTGNRARISGVGPPSDVSAGIPVG